VQNAVIDALAHLGVRHIDLPCTPERVWATIRDARAGTLAEPWSEPPDVFARLRAAADAPTEEDAPAQPLPTASDPAGLAVGPRTMCHTQDIWTSSG
jgi:hypothetical protein